MVREITAEELAAKAGYSRPHTLHCGPDAIFMSALGGAGGDEGPAGIALLDHDTVITSEWGTPSMIENGLNPEDLLGRKFGHHLNFWSMSQRTITQRVDLGDQHQMVLELRPAHDPAKTWGSATRSGLHNCWRTRWRRAGTGPAAGLRARNSMKLP